MTLLPYSHPTHLRRLCREINNNRAGVYLCATVAGTTGNPRLCGRAKLHKNTTARGEASHLITFPVGGSRAPFYVHAHQVGDDTFTDGGSGRSICASRIPTAADRAEARRPVAAMDPAREVRGNHYEGDTFNED